ncbi:hypothetical protein CYMTET_51087, partial [Cymbomonas tetramitiformis]
KRVDARLVKRILDLYLTKLKMVAVEAKEAMVRVVVAKGKEGIAVVEKEGAREATGDEVLRDFKSERKVKARLSNFDMYG